MSHEVEYLEKFKFGVILLDMGYMKVIHAEVQLCMTLFVKLMGLQESYSIMYLCYLYTGL